jgi:hypothetical protein
VSDAQGVDGKGHQVTKYDANGTVLMTLREPLREPTDVVTTASGDIFVTKAMSSAARQPVSKWSKDGTF